ncbi:putative F-box domain-containing protein [Helianthus annuus]|nr:putative F-box domain-containing protein [Helianthus annuus]KAJ0748532.1 putative F-box domain-containing protein [Helianthus annuus]
MEGGGMGVGRVITDWSEIPVELLMRVVSSLDDRTVVVASAVCCGWRDAICWGLTRISFSCVYARYASK